MSEHVDDPAIGRPAIRHLLERKWHTGSVVRSSRAVNASFLQASLIGINIDVEELVAGAGGQRS